MTGDCEQPQHLIIPILEVLILISQAVAWVTLSLSSYSKVTLLICSDTDLLIFSENEFETDVTISHFFQYSQLGEMRQKLIPPPQPSSTWFCTFWFRSDMLSTKGMKVSWIICTWIRKANINFHALISLHSYYFWTKACCLGHLLQGEYTERTPKVMRLGCQSAVPGLFGSRCWHIPSDICFSSSVVTIKVQWDWLKIQNQRECTMKMAKGTFT